MILGTRRLVVLGALVALLGCGPPPFLVHVTYPDEVDVERGSPVIYQGVQVGHVRAIALRQDEPREAAVIEVTLAVTEPSVVLREKDRFHLASHRGVAVVEVEPWPETSAPLSSGGTVAGVPMLVTRVEESVEAAVESIAAVVVEAVGAAREALEQVRERAREQHDADGTRSLGGSGHADRSP